MSLLPRMKTAGCFALILTILGFPAAGQELKVFFGNLHSHTSYSDGSAKPDDAYLYARDVAKLDFMAITEHNHAEAGKIANNPALYSGAGPDSLISTAGRFLENDRFIAIYGQEFSSISSGNHGNVLDVNTVISSTDVPNGAWGKLLTTWLPAHLDTSGKIPVLLLNHPETASSPNAKEYGRDDFPTVAAWLSALDERACLINIVNGPSHDEGIDHPVPRDSEDEFLRYLNLGLHVAPTADQDNHKKNWGNSTTTRTGVIAASLTKAALMDALRERHVYATTDKNLRIIAKIDGHLIGTRVLGSDVRSAGSTFNITLDIADDDEPGGEYQVLVYGDQIGGNAEADVIKSADFQGNGSFTISGVPYAGGNRYYFLKVIQTDDDGIRDTVWTAPVWFEPTGTAPPSVTVLSLAVDLVREIATITNLGNTKVAMGGWTLTSMVGTNQKFTFPAGFSLAPGAVVKVVAGPDAVHQPPAVLKWTKEFIWRNAGDPGQLRNTAGQLIASTP